jgi:hypothetical protein
MPRHVEKMTTWWLKEYTEESEAAIITQKEITPGFNVFTRKPELKMVK